MSKTLLEIKPVNGVMSIVYRATGGVVVRPLSAIASFALNEIEEGGRNGFEYVRREWSSEEDQQ